MAGATRLEDLADRCSVYLEELRELFHQRSLSSGTPVDITALAARLHDPSFRDEMTSMVRSVLYREEAPLSRSELMELLALAAGGLHFEDSGLSLHEPLREILTFCNEVLSAQRRGFGSYELTPPSPTGLEHGPTPEVPLPLSETSAANSLAPVSTVDEPALPVTPASSGMSRSPHPEQTIASVEQAHKLVASDVVGQGVAATAVPPNIGWKASTPATEASVAAPADRPSTSLPGQAAPPRRSWTGVLQRNYWLPGALVLLLVSAGVLFLRQQYPHTPAPITNKPPFPIDSLATKPSAYGPSLHAHRHNPPVAAQGSLRPSDQGQAPTAPTSQLREAGTPPAPTPKVIPIRPPAKALVPPNKRSTLRDAAATDHHEGVFLASSGVMASHLLSAPAPTYPRLASFTHVQGQVIVQVVVSREGRVEATRVLEGPLLLRSGAEHAIRRWRYRPYLVDGKPTDVATIVTVSFRLQH